jgi:hypothetical protein
LRRPNRYPVNRPSGIWYSFPAAGECRPSPSGEGEEKGEVEGEGAPLELGGTSAGGCAWRRDPTARVCPLPSVVQLLASDQRRSAHKCSSVARARTAPPHYHINTGAARQPADRGGLEHVKLLWQPRLPGLVRVTSLSLPGLVRPCPERVVATARPAAREADACPPPPLPPVRAAPGPRRCGRSRATPR